MPNEWAEETNAVTPPSANTVLDYVDTPTFEHPQPFTISFSRSQPVNPSENSGLRAQIQYRTGTFSRSVLCDWRGQASLTAQQVSVKAVSFAPRSEAYMPSGAAVRHSVMVGLGAVAKSSVVFSGDAIPIPVDDVESDVRELQVPAMATRLQLRAVYAGGAAGWDGLPVLEDLIGAGRILLYRGALFHNELLALSHFQQGLDLGDADVVRLDLPTGLTDGTHVVITPVWELAL